MELDWLAVVIATVVGMAVAGAWYGKVFTTPVVDVDRVAARTPGQPKEYGAAARRERRDGGGTWRSESKSRQWRPGTVRCGWLCWWVSARG